MKSKISFFNKTIFKKNVTLYWPIWSLYTIFLVFVQPFIFWSSCYYSKFYDKYTYTDKLGDLLEVIYLDIHVMFIAYVALASGMALFRYLYSHKSANMIHAFPVDRMQLFGTNVISGISFLAVPQTISCVLLAIIALSNGLNEIHYIAYWWLLALGTDIVAFAVVTFCAMFTGHILALPVYTAVLNYLSYIVYYFVYIVSSNFTFGVSDLGRKAMRLATFLSPTECFANNIGIYDRTNAFGEIVEVQVYGIEILLIYLIVAAILYTVAFLTYKKRHVEQAGEFVTVAWLKPIFCFAIALGGGFFTSMLMREFLRSIGIGCNMTLYIVLFLVLGGIFFFVADMFIHKSFHVFKKKNWMNCGICMVALAITFFATYFGTKAYEDYQPKLSEIDKAYVAWGYDIELKGEDVAVILDLHKKVLENKDICIREIEAGNWDYEYVRFEYVLDNGEYVSRGYEIFYGYEELESVLRKIGELEEDPENYLDYLFVNNYEKIEKFYSGRFEAPLVKDVTDYGDGNYEISNFQSVEFSPEQAKELFDAVVADAKAGTLMKYNVYSQWRLEGYDETQWKYSEAAVMIEFQNPNRVENTQLITNENSVSYPGHDEIQYIDEDTWYQAYISFGPDCENIVKKLIEFGAINSIDDVWWGVQ